jgi:hypothetical protein
MKGDANCFIKMYFNVIFSSTQRFSYDLFFSDASTKICMRLSYIPCVLHIHLIPADFSDRSNIW